MIRRTRQVLGSLELRKGCGEPRRCVRRTAGCVVWLWLFAVAGALATPVAADTCVTLQTGVCCTDGSGTNCSSTVCAADADCTVAPFLACGGASQDDGRIYRYGSTVYPPNTATVADDTFKQTGTQRSLYAGSPATFFVQNGAMRFNTGAVLPGNGTVTSAALTVQVLEPLESADGLSLTGEWYNWGPTVGPEDYSEVPFTSAFSVPVSSITAGSNTIPLSGVAANVSVTGYTYLRTHMSQRPGDAAPTGVNAVLIALFDNTTVAGPALTVCYTGSGPLPTPKATPTGTNTPAVTPTPTIVPRAMEDGRYLPPNTWVRLSTIPTQRFIPKGFIDCTQMKVLSHPVGRRASSIAYGGGIFYFGGGGQSYPGNDVELFDIALNTWTQQYPPECLPACCGIACCSPPPTPCSDACYIETGVGTTTLTPMGQPYVEKTFQLVAYNPLRQKYTTALTSGLWEWDPSTREWSRLTPDRPESTDIATKMLVYDPDLETVLYFATTQYNHTVFRFDYAANAWVAHSPIPPQITWAEIFSAYDSKEHKYLVWHGTRTMWIYNARAGTWTQLQNVPDSAVFRNGSDSGTRSMGYDPIAGVFLLAKKDDNTANVQLWSYRIVTDTWTALDVAGGPPRGPTTSYNGLVYDDVWKRFYFLNVRSIGGGGEGGDGEGDVETWAYRIGGPIGPGDANCDGRVTAADLPALIRSLASNPTDGCGAVDTNRDGVVSGEDLSDAVDALFKAPQ